MTAPALSPWLAKAARLEEDRRTLLRVWDALHAATRALWHLKRTLDDARLRLNGRVFGLLASPVMGYVDEEVGQALTALNARQEEYLARMLGTHPEPAGLAGDLALTRGLDRPEIRRMRGHQTPVISRALLADVERSAERRGLTPRGWLEMAISSYQASSGGKHGSGLNEAIRNALGEQPATCAALARQLGRTPQQVGSALGDLQRRGLVHFSAGKGCRGGLWVSLEEP